MFYTILTYVIIISAILVATLLPTHFIRKFVSIREKSIPLSFSDDILFLDHLITLEVNKFQVDFETLNHDIDTVNNIKYKEELERISEKILTKLSDNYMIKMSLYFSTKGLYQYVINNVDSRLIVFIMQKNKMKS